MSRLPQLLLLFAVTAACGDTVPLNNRRPESGDDAGAGGDAGGSPAQGGTSMGATGGAGSPESGGEAGGAEGGSGGTQPVGGTQMASGGTDGNDAGASGSSGEAGTLGFTPGLCASVSGGPVASGTRLKAECVQSPDGSQVLRRGKLFDSELGVECAFRTGADEIWRCLPTLELGADATASILFKDDQCKQGMVWFPAPPAACAAHVPAYVYALGPNPKCGVGDGRDLTTHIYTLGENLPKPSSPAYSMNGNQCTQHVVPQSAVFYRLGDEVPPTSFVSGTRGLAP